MSFNFKRKVLLGERIALFYTSPLFKLVVIVQVLENAALKFLSFATLQESRLDALRTFTLCSYYLVFKV